ncbi:hypothetical protein CU097_005191 [Rhizopus azygosporus]|uniref:Uncharacterized protein n=1 Tax=Rhizopus azygosporus TaxID=86630 RepID=A0A367JV18_RHIAZ|nr:hypothetical protein CU097_005191 [Rhizopus azygosporus]
MVESDRSQKFAGTYRKLFDTIERGVEQCSTDLLQTLLEEKYDQLKLGIDAFTAASAQSRSKLTTGTIVSINGKSITFDQKEKDLVLKISDIINLNELQCAALWHSYKTDNHEYVDQQNSVDIPLHENTELIMNIANFYFEERISLLECIQSLQRISSDSEHPFNNIASSMVEKLFEDSTNNIPFVNKLLLQFSKLIRSQVPTRTYSFPGWSTAWAKQNIKEQKALLEILFLFTITTSLSPDFVVSVVQEFEVNNFGRFQVCSYALDTEGERIREQVSCISILIVVSMIIPPYLTLDVKLDPAAADASLIDSPNAVAKINQIVLHMGNSPEHSAFLLAWSYFLTCLRNAVDAAPSLPSGYDQVKLLLEGKQQVSFSVLADRSFARAAGFDAAEERTISIQQSDHLERTLVGRALKLNVFDTINAILESNLCDEDDVNSVGYRVVIRLLLKSFLATTLPQFLPMESYSSLINCFTLLYRDQPMPCQDFWNEDVDQQNQYPLLTAALGRFPVYFTHLTDMLASLATTNELDTRIDEKPVDKVYEFMCALPTITVVLKDTIFTSAAVENDVPVVQVDQNLQITPSLNYITGISIPRQSRGILLSNTQDSRIVQFAHGCSGWHMLVSILANSMQQTKPAATVDVTDEDYTLVGENPEAIISILNLIYRVLSNSPKLGPTLVDHVQKTAAVPGRVYEVPILISILCDILSFSSGIQQCPISIATLAIKCLTMLLPYYRQYIWPYLQKSPLLPRITPIPGTGSMIKLPFITSRALNIQQIIAKFECTLGSYELLLSFLDLVHGLVHDIQSNWWVREAAVNLSPDAQAQMETLYVCLHYLMLEVFPSYSGWRYRKVSERYLIGIKLLSIFIVICNYFRESNQPSTSGLSLGRIRDGIFSNFLYDGGIYHVSPLLDVVSDGAVMANALYKSSHIKEAQRTEELTALTLVFIKILLQRRLEHINEGTNISESTLERLMLERTASGSCSDFLLRIAKHINYRHNIALPIQATYVLTLLCRTTSAWKTVPSFVQYLGDTAEAHTIIRAYLETAKDDSQNETLLSAIWHLISTLLETQPSLAILFLDCGDFIMPSPKSAVRQLGGQTLTQTTTVSNTESAIRAAISMLEKWSSLSLEKPSVVSNVLRFLSTFWQTAFDHYALVENTRSDSALWDVIGKILLNPSMEVDTSADILESVDFLETDFGENDHFDLSVRQLCCSNLSKAFALRVIAYEIHLTAGNEKSKNGNLSKILEALPGGLKALLIKLSEPTRLSQMRQEYIKNGFDSSLTDSVHHSAGVLLRTIGIENTSALLFKSAVIGTGDDGAPGDIRQYGDSYLYNLRMTVSRVFPLYSDIKEKYNLADRDNMLITPKINAALEVERLSDGLLRKIIEANHNYSVVDSQLILFRSFKSFIETCSHHASVLIWVEKNNIDSFDNLHGFLSELIVQAKSEQRQDGVTLTSYSMLVHLIRNLIEDWIYLSKPTLSGTDDSAKQKYSSQVSQLLISLSDLLTRENLAYKDSVSDKTAVYFHRPLLEAVMLCIFTLRGTMESVNKNFLKSVEMQTCLGDVLSVVCDSFHVLSIKALSYSAEGSTASEEDVNRCIKDITIVTSLLQELVHERYGILQEAWVFKFKAHHTIDNLLKLFYGGIDIMLNEIDSLNITPYAEIALYFLLTLANIPKAAEVLVTYHVFDTLTNNRLTTRLQQGTLDLFIRFGDKTKKEPGYVERNPLHSIWCQILAVVSSLLRTNGKSDIVLKSTVNLLQICGPQIGKAFEKANSSSDSLFALAPLESLSMPLLEELERINSVFFELSKHLERIPNIATNLFTSYKDCSLLLLQRYLYYFTHPSHMKAQLYRTDNTETTDHFMQKTLRSILTITHHMMTSLVVLSSSELVLTAPDIEWPFGNIIIYPNMRASTDAEASFGTLVECINASIVMINQWQDAKDEPLEQALDVIQSCSLMLTSQAALWVAKPDLSDEVRMGIAVDNIMDIVETLSKAATTMEKLVEKKIVGDIRLRIKLIYMLQTFLSERFFEN